MTNLTKKKTNELSVLEETMLFHIRGTKLPEPLREFQFHPTRKWRFDFAWPTFGVAVECEGGIYSGGGHVRGKQYEDNCEKYNHAILLGWKVLRFGTNQIKKGNAIELLVKLFTQLERDQTDVNDKQIHSAN